MQTISKKISLMNSQGHLLDARLDIPLNKPPKAYAIYAPCFTCVKEIHVAHRISLFLAAHGIAVLRFDFSGLGGSEGKFSDSNFSTNVEDIKVAAAFLQQNYQPAQLMIGHSLGGTAALVATHELEEIQAVVTLNSPFQPQHVMHHFEQEKAIILSKGRADIYVDGRNFEIQTQFLKDLEAYDMEKIIPHLNAALLVMHAPEDKIVNIQQASSIFLKAKHPKSFISLDTANHLISDINDAHYVASLIYEWVLRYLK